MRKWAECENVTSRNLIVCAASLCVCVLLTYEKMRSDCVTTMCMQIFRGIHSRLRVDLWSMIYLSCDSNSEKITMMMMSSILQRNIQTQISSILTSKQSFFLANTEFCKCRFSALQFSLIRSASITNWSALDTQPATWPHEFTSSSRVSVCLHIHKIDLSHTLSMIE